MIEFMLVTVMRILTGVIAQSRGFSFDPPAQRIYYANHTSHLDTLLIWGLIPRSQRPRVRPAAAKDYWWKSPLRKYLAENVFHAIPVMRQRESSSDDPLHALQAALAQGDSLIFFPEGTRGTGEAIQPFKSGLYRLAVNCPRVVLVPVYMNNLNRVLPKGELLPVPMICTVRFGSGITLEAGETKTEFIARAQSALEALNVS